MSYYRDSMLMKKAIHSGEADFSILLEDFEYVSSRYDFITGASASWIIERMVIIVSYFCFDSFLVITIVFAAITYGGMFRMFQAFTAMMPQQHFVVAMLVLFFPSVTMYGSGIQKDSICIAALGWITYYLQLMFFQKQVKMKYLLYIFICCVLISVIKIYIIAAFAIPCIFFIVISIIKKVENKVFRILLVPVLLGVMLIGYLAVSQKIQEMLGSYATESLAATIAQQQQGYKNLEDESGSFFEIGPMETSLSGLAKKIPLGVATTLYRPFLWEARNVMILFSAIESFLLLIFTIYVIFKTGLFRFIASLFSNPFIFLCIFFSILFSAFVGVSTLNFGTLARYRIPILPFYSVGILYIFLVFRKKKNEQTSTTETIAVADNVVYIPTENK